MWYVFISDRHVGATEEEKQDHEKTFKEIGEAYGVLSDAKQKSRYDAGQDLDNSTSSSSYSSNGNNLSQLLFDHMPTEFWFHSWRIRQSARFCFDQKS